MNHDPGGFSKRLLGWGLCGVLLVLLSFAILFLGPHLGLSEMFLPGISPSMACVIGATLIYGAAVLLTPAKGASKTVVVLLVAVGLAMRGAMFLVPARSGVDYNRYFWDGAMTAHGLNPYQYSPQQLLSGPPPNATIRDLLASGGSDVLRHTNHPNLPTIYPPVAQAAFALAYRLAPFKITGWRIVLLLFDLIAAFLVWSLLRMARAPLAQWAIYLWNPLLVIEIYHNAHLDMLTAALVVLYLWTLARGRFLEAGASLALGVGAKVWPAFLGMFLVRRAWPHKRALISSLALAGALTAVVMAPYLLALFQKTSGLGTYAKGSHDNYLAHGWLTTLAEGLLALSGSSFPSDRLARLLTVPVLIGAAVWQGLRSGPSARSLCDHAGVFILVMVLVSPTVYSWYFVPLVPLAAVTRKPFLLLAATLPVMLNFPRSVIESRVLMPLVHGPLWLGLAFHWYFGWKRKDEESREEDSCASSPDDERKETSA